MFKSLPGTFVIKCSWGKVQTCKSVQKVFFVSSGDSQWQKCVQSWIWRMNRNNAFTARLCCSVTSADPTKQTCTCSAPTLIIWHQLWLQMLNIFSDSFFFLSSCYSFSQTPSISVFIFSHSLWWAPALAASGAAVEIACAILSRCLLNINQNWFIFWGKSGKYLIYVHPCGWNEFHCQTHKKIFKKFS